MVKTSAGILLYRRTSERMQVFLVHPGGPFFMNKDEGSWSIPKGEIDKNEDPLAAARREFEEETGCSVHGNFLRLSPVKQKSGKIVLAWALEGECDPGMIKSNTFTIEWPPKSGRMREFPEVDRAAWFTVDEAKKKINSAQSALLEELARIVNLARS